MGHDETLREIEANGLIETLTSLKSSALHDKVLASVLADFLSSRGTVLDARDEDDLRDLSVSDFFGIQTFLCWVLEELSLPNSDVLSFFLLLVEKGGNDLAAYRPHVSLLEWLRASSARADEVIDSARKGDKPARLALAIALESKGDPQEALRSAEATGAERISGIRALARLDLDREQTLRALEIALASVNTGAPSSEDLSLMRGVLQLGAKHSDIDRDAIAQSLNRLSEIHDEAVVHFMASALLEHFDQMMPIEVQSCATSIENVDPRNTGTIQSVDMALLQIVLSDPSVAFDIVSRIISTSKGQVGRDQLKMSFSEMEQAANEQRCQMAIKWLLEGDKFVCSNLGNIVSEVGRADPWLRVSAADLPAEVDQQILLCRRAVGHLFISPMAAASFVVATLEKGDSEVVSEVSGLLYDPLLINYSGALKRWLSSVVDDAQVDLTAISQALDRIDKVEDGMSAASTLVELQPPTSHRELILFKQAEQMSSVQEAAFSESLFAQLVSTQTILYGNESGHTAIDEAGSRTHRTVPFSEKSISIELPREEIFDPIGLQFTLMCLRVGQGEA